ncbi:MAG: hypothetical protein H0T46_23560 [Deltaproteobacteria bacterium]|nr:hypothetical protein [Deltaproteobacteria bacterium]
MNKQELEDEDQVIGRPHSPREDEEERDGLRVSANEASDEEEEEIELHDDDILFDDDDRADLDIEPDDDRGY